MSRFGRWWDWLRQSLKRDRGTAPQIDPTDAVDRPILSPVSGQYNDSVEVTITCATAGAAIYYETDGSTPTAASTLYSAPFTLNTVGTHDVKAIGIKAGLLDSAIGGATYEVVDSTPPPSGFDSHPPYMDLPWDVMEGRADSPPGAVIYMDPAGDDGNTGASGSPIFSLQRASALVSPGDTVMMADGHYFWSGSEGRFTASGTATNPIYIRSAPGEIAYWNFCHPEPWNDPATAWEVVSDGIPDHYRTTFTSDRGLDKQQNRVVGGFFGDSLLPLWRFATGEDGSNWRHFASENQFLTPGDDGAVLTTGIYTGPGAVWKFIDKRYHVRLSHTEVPTLDLVDFLGVGSGFSNNYTGEKDPRNIQLLIPRGEETGFKIMGSHVIVQDVVTIGADGAGLCTAGTTGVRWDNCFVYRNSYFGTSLTGNDIDLYRVRFRGGDAPWVSRFAAKNLTSRTGLVSITPTVSFNVNRCEFSGAHDANPRIWNDGVDGDFSRNIVRHVNDDAVYMPHRTAVTGMNIRVWLNDVRNALSFFPVRDGGTTATVPDADGIYYFRNRLDKRYPIYYNPPYSDATSDLTKSYEYGALILEHAPAVYPNHYWYFNTILAHEAFGYGYAGVGKGLGGTIRKVYNTIIASRDTPSVLVANEESAIEFETDSNLFYSPNGSSAARTNDLNANPAFANVDLDTPNNGSDISLLVGSPARDSAAAIPASWPDVPGFSQTDRGAVPYGMDSTIFGPDSTVED